MSCSDGMQDMKDVDCNQLTSLFAVTDWQTLAAETFVAKKKDQWGMETQASAKSLISGFDDCKISRTQFLQNKPFDEMFTYTCNAPISTADGNDLLAAARAVASHWQSCLAGWTEQSRLTETRIGDFAIVDFHSDNYKGYSVAFARSCIGLCKKGGLTALVFHQRDPVELRITKFIRK